jgi:hypothetical protein
MKVVGFYAAMRRAFAIASDVDLGVRIINYGEAPQGLQIAEEFDRGGTR